MDRASYPFVHFIVKNDPAIIEQVRGHFSGQQFHDFGKGHFSVIDQRSAGEYQEWLETWLPEGSVTFLAKMTGLMSRP